ADRTADEGKEKPECQCRFLFCHRLLLVRYSDRSFHANFCHCSMLWLVRAGAGATGRQSPLPAVEPVHRRTGRQKSRANRRARLKKGRASCAPLLAVISLRHTAVVPPSNPSPCECASGHWDDRKR